MNKKLITLIRVFVLTLLPDVLSAQNIEMADTMRSEGKIYVVVVIAFFVLAILSSYLISIDRRLRKMEKQQNSGK